jgi:hypothetical protein
MRFSGVTRMTVLGTSLIAIRVAVVCAGLAFWQSAPRTDPAALDSPDIFRAILDALDEEDCRNRDRD